MSKRFSILAAALVASGRSLSTTFIDRPGPRQLELPSRQFDYLSIEERSRLAFADPEEGAFGSNDAYSAMPCDFPFDP